MSENRIIMIFTSPKTGIIETKCEQMYKKFVSPKANFVGVVHPFPIKKCEIVFIRDGAFIRINMVVFFLLVGFSCLLRYFSHLAASQTRW